MSTIINKTYIKNIVDKYNKIVNDVKIKNDITPSSSLFLQDNGFDGSCIFPKKRTIESLQTCINFLEHEFSYNCNCKINMNCCQTCQSECYAPDELGCQTCQFMHCEFCEKCESSSCQTAGCQTKTCQLCQTCQPCESCEICEKCEKCQTCQSTSCQSIQCEKCQSCETCQICETCQTCETCESCEVCQIKSCQTCQTSS